MRKLIDIVSIPDLVLLEAQRYEDMFGQVMKFSQMLDVGREERYGVYSDDDINALDADLIDVVRQRQLNIGEDRYEYKFSKQIKEYLDFSKDTLKKSDRIVWFLRLARLKMLSKFRNYTKYSSNKRGPREAAAYAFGEKLYEKYLNEQLNTSGDDHSDISADEIMGDLKHYLSLPIPEIQNFVFDRQPFQKVYGAFRIAEKKWQEETRNTMPVTDRDDIVISRQIGDSKWEWVHLNRAYCSAEAEAMGHCGNSPRDGTSDTILSLRKRISRGNSDLWKPYATFILLDNGSLSEMKGRFNNKPGADGERESVMAMIAELLKLPIIKGIVGGGHAAHMNFSIDDLEPDKRDELINHKPVLADAYNYLRLKGYDETFAQKLETEMEDIGKPIVEVNDDYVVVEVWQDVARLDNDIWFDDDNPIKHIADFTRFDFEELGIDGMTDLIENLRSGMFKEFWHLIPEDEKSADYLVRDYLGNERTQRFLQRLWDKISEISTSYYIKYINELEWSLGANSHFALTENARGSKDAVEMRVGTENLAAGLALLKRGHETEDDEDQFDSDELLGAATLTQIWTAHENNIDQIDIEPTPDELIERIKPLVKKAIGQYLKKIAS